MVVTRVPEEVRRLTDAFVEELERTLGARFVGLFQYGAVCFPPSPISDFDAHVIVDGPFTDGDRAAVGELLERMLAYPRGDDMDVWFVTRDAVAKREPPQTEMRPGFRDESWALHRAHVHAGRFVHAKGLDPRTIVPEPMWDELDTALQGELEYAQEHLADAPAFAVLNLCRILYSYETRDVVIGKLQAAVWALAALDVDLHPVVRQALHAYDTRTNMPRTDVHPFYEAIVPRIQIARGHADPGE